MTIETTSLHCLRPPNPWRTAGIMMLLFGIFTSPMVLAAKSVDIPDPNFESVLRERIEKPEGPIEEIELASVEVIFATGAGITDIEGIQFCTGLKRLGLHQNRIENLTPIGALTQLEYLHLGDNGLTGMEELAPLVHLRELLIHANEITDLTPLSEMKDLVFLDIAVNKISDLSPLQAIPQVERIDLQLNEIVDIAPLASMKNLTGLNIGENRIEDLSPLSELKNLERLYAFTNRVRDVSPLASMTQLTWLHLGNNQIQSVTPLAALTHLTKLILDTNGIVEVDPLTVHKGLAELNLHNNKIVDISPFVEDPDFKPKSLVLLNNPLTKEAASSQIDELTQRGIDVRWWRSSIAMGQHTGEGVKSLEFPEPPRVPIVTYVLMGFAAACLAGLWHLFGRGK